MTPTHHTPATPGAIRSIIAAHMFCLGTERDMLSQDLQLATRRCVQAEGDVEDARTDWQHSSGAARARRWRDMLEAMKRWRVQREASAAALRRLAGHRVGREAA